MREDENGYVDFGLYRPDFFPNDPTYDDCTVASSGDPCYGSVIDWDRELNFCGEPLEVSANACTATEIRWFDDADNLLGSGESYSVEEAGTYIVQLSNAGGVLQDTVVVEGSELVADFAYTRENFQVEFTSQSTGFTGSPSWNFGDEDSDYNSSTGVFTSHYFEGAAGDYDVTMTVFNTNCGTEESLVETITIECDDQPEEIADGAVSVVEGCDGTESVVTFTTPNFASSTKVFYGSEEIAENEEEVTFSIDRSADIKIEAYPACNEGGVPTYYEESVVLLDAPDASFTAENQGVHVVVTPSQEGDDVVYTWSATDATTEEPLEDTDGTLYYKYPTTVSSTTICLEVTNECGTTDDPVCEEVDIIITGLSSQNASGELSVFPTLTSDELSVTLKGTATVLVSDLVGNIISENVITDNGTIDVSGLSVGVYLLVIEQDGETLTKRFVKE